MDRVSWIAFDLGLSEEDFSGKDPETTNESVMPNNVDRVWMSHLIYGAPSIAATAAIVVLSLYTAATLCIWIAEGQGVHTGIAKQFGVKAHTQVLMPPPPPPPPSPPPPP